MVTAAIADSASDNDDCDAVVVSVVVIVNVVAIAVTIEDISVAAVSFVVTGNSVPVNIDDLVCLFVLVPLPIISSSYCCYY